MFNLNKTLSLKTNQQFGCISIPIQYNIYIYQIHLFYLIFPPTNPTPCSRLLLSLFDFYTYFHLFYIFQNSDDFLITTTACPSIYQNQRTSMMKVSL